MTEDPRSFTPDQLNAIACISTDAIADIVDVFIHTGRDRVTAILGAFESSDWERIMSLAHSLKGSAAAVGADRLSWLAAEVEIQAGAQAPVLTAHLEAFRADLLPEFERARAGVEAYVLGMDS